MNRLLLIVTFVVIAVGGAAVGLTGCAGTAISKVTHEDLQGAAAYATANGVPARAAIYAAIDLQLTACENAIAAAKPANRPASFGFFTAFEMGAEAVGTGMPSSIKLNCEPIPLPALLFPRP